MDESFLHRLSGDDIYAASPSISPYQFLLEDRYSGASYQGILPDTGAADVSTVGRQQLVALQQEEKVRMDTSTAGRSSVQFGKGAEVANIGTATVHTAIGPIDFEVIDAPTPFLLCLKDMDRLKVYFDNTTNELVQSIHDSNGTTTVRYPVVRKW